LCCLSFIASVGLLNIISAAFLERIMTYSATKLLRKQRERLHDKRRWHDNVARLIDILLLLHEQTTYDVHGEIEHKSVMLDSKLRKQVGYQRLTKMSHESLLEKSFSRELLDLAVECDEEVKQILENLDIEPQDCLSLADTLDRNQNGQVDVVELVSGLKRLRGPARRSDIIAVDLAVQSMEVKMDEIWLYQQQQQLQQQQRQQQKGHGVVDV